MNLPDDWGSYYQKCSECGGPYHLRGSEVCYCPPEEVTDDDNAEE